MHFRADRLWLLAALLALPGAAHAASMKECSAKYQAAKKAGTLNGQDWAAFRAAQCSTSATPAGAGAASATPSAATAPAASAPAPTAPATTASAAPAPSPAKAATASPDVSSAVFPSAVSSKYASQTLGKQRMHTCLDQYHANKASNGNGGLKWIQKGGGYYSACLKRLKAG